MPIKPAKPALPPKPRLRSSDGSFAARGVVSGKILRKIWTNPVPVAPTGFGDPREALHFHTDFCAENVDKVNAVIRGVSVITSGLIARGHDLEVDNTTLDQIKTCAETKGQVPVKIDHKSGAAAVCGYLTNFHLDGAKLKADWHLLKTHPQKDTILEVAEVMPRGVGLSASFLPPAKTEKTASGKNAARCEELISVDYVTLPAANPDGMFEAKPVDSSADAKLMTPEELKQAIAEALAPITERLDSIESQQNLMADPPSLEDLAGMSDEDLAALGITREEVNEAIAEAQAGEGEDEGTGEGEGEGAGEGEVAGAAGLQAVLTEVRTFAAQLQQVKAERELAAQQAAIDGITEKFDAVLEQNRFLHEMLETGGAAVSHGAGPVQLKAKTGAVVNFGTAEPGDFEKRVIETLESDPKLTQAKAFEAVIRAHPQDYNDYLVRRGLKKA
ncbi:hypothetical protein OpiT1DRAFT_05620 [Opitutaceae bacterium TAV1]|nr:hypothetical protein OpiT1DRAFT_05620 [Opitutaceae bacterium TAV1]